MGLSSPKIGLTSENNSVARNTKFYPPRIDRPEYALTKHIVTAVNMSWEAPKTVDLQTNQLKKITLPVGDANCDLASFTYVVKKYSQYLNKNTTEFTKPDDAFKTLLAISNVEYDMRMLGEFFNHTKQNNPDLLKILANVFQETPKGEVLVQALFNCSVKELKANPQEAQFNQNIDIEQLKENLIAKDAGALQRFKRASGYFTDIAYAKIFQKKAPELEEYNMFEITSEDHFSKRATYDLLSKMEEV